MSDAEVYRAPRGKALARREEPGPVVHQCRWCGAQTAYATMSSLGARCSSCYDAYCRRLPERPPEAPPSAIPPHAGPAAWAYRLRWRHQQGERLTAAQVSMYAEAIARREFGGTEGDAR